MYIDTRKTINKVFGTDDKEQQDKALADTQKKMQKVFGTETARKYNPFLNSDGSLKYKNLDYQKLVDGVSKNKFVSGLITEAAGVTPTADNKSPATGNSNQINVNNGDVQNNKLGFISAKYETGGYNGGLVSSGKGDYGGISYGIPQLSTKTGSADNFVSWLKDKNSSIWQMFGNSKAGSEAFGKAWQEAYKKYGDDFSSLQTEYAYNSFVKPLVDLAKKRTGVDYTRSSALMELVYSTAIQFGGGELGLKALGKVSNNMSDKDIINASYDEKINNVGSFFKSSSKSVQNAVGNRFRNERNDVLALAGQGTPATSRTASNNISQMVGKKVADVSGYNNSAAVGQCVWYARGRIKEKLGKDTKAMGNGNEMWYNATKGAKLSATADNIKPNTVVSYQRGASAAGQKYGHVIFIEDVVGDTVYYTEGGSTYYKNGTIGTLKTASKKGILEGINSNGSRFGSGIIGIIDANKL